MPEATSVFAPDSLAYDIGDVWQGADRVYAMGWSARRRRDEATASACWSNRQPKLRAVAGRVAVGGPVIAQLRAELLAS